MSSKSVFPNLVKSMAELGSYAFGAKSCLNGWLLGLEALRMTFSLCGGGLGLSFSCWGELVVDSVEDLVGSGLLGGPFCQVCFVSFS